MAKFDFNPFIAQRVPAGAQAGAGRERMKYDFGTGFPDPDVFPIEDMKRALSTALDEKGRDLVRYPDPRGLPEAREFIAQKLRRERGMHITADQVLITGGSGMALAIVSQLIANPGDTLLVEEYVYTGTLGAMRSVTANIVGVPMDAQGMTPDGLEQTIQEQRRQGHPPKLIYVIPTFQNPVGSEMGAQRRKDVLAMAQKYGIPVFEDDAYEDLRFSGTRTPAIHSMDDSGMVLYCGTFSKIIGPGMRVGYLISPQEIMPRVMALNWGRPTSEFAVLASYYFLRDHLTEHVAEINAALQSKRDTMLGAIGEFMGDGAEANHPEGGLYLWVRLREGANTQAAMAKARERGIAYIPGTSFSPSGATGQNYFRACFAYENHQKIRDGIQELAKVFQQEGLLK